MARGNHLYNLSPVTVGTGALMEAEPWKHCSCPAHTLQPAAPSLQGDVYLSPAIFGGVTTSPSVWHSLLHCSLLQGTELLCQALGTWRTASQLVLPLSVSSTGSREAVCCTGRGTNSKRGHIYRPCLHTVHAVHAVRCTCS